MLAALSSATNSTSRAFISLRIAKRHETIWLLAMAKSPSEERNSRAVTRTCFMCLALLHAPIVRSVPGCNDQQKPYFVSLDTELFVAKSIKIQSALLPGRI